MNTLLVMGILGAIAWLSKRYLRRDSPRVRAVLVAFSLAVLARYFAWRVWNLPRPEPSAYVAASYAFFALELLAAYFAVDELLVLRRTANRTPEVDAQLDWYENRPPRVDILIVTYNEPWEILERTIVGATTQQYPNCHVWVLDDGHRAWLREKTEERDVGYLTRTDIKHHKAGNLNAGIQELRSRGIALEYLALLDADFIALPQFLRRTTALMKVPDVGIVQTPQCFYNPDPHQQAFGGVRSWPDEQRGWFDVFLPSLDAQGGASCCGTSCLIRMEALDAIEGFPTESVSEDTLCSMKMNQKGWRTVFLNERLTVGLAPEGIGEFLSQRARWVLGGVQNARIGGAPSGIRARGVYWLNLWRNAIVGLLPLAWVVVCIVYSFSGVLLVPIPNWDQALSYFSPFLLDRLFHGWLFAGRQTLFISDAIQLLLAPLWVKQNYLAVIGSKFGFKVTDKAVHREKRVVHWRLVRFHALLVVLLVAGIIYNISVPSASFYGHGVLHVHTLASIWFVLLIVAGTAPVIAPPNRRAAERYPSSEVIAAVIDGTRREWSCVNVSTAGALVRMDGQNDLPPTLQLEVSGIGTIRGRVARASPDFAAFAFETIEARSELIQKLYCTSDYIPWPARWSLARAFWGFARHLLSGFKLHGTARLVEGRRRGVFSWSSRGL